MHQPEADESNQELDKLYAVVEIKNKKRQICLLETHSGTVAAVTASIKAANGLVVRFAADAGASKRNYILVEYVKVQDLMNVKSATDKRYQPESVTEAVQKAANDHQSSKDDYEIKDLFAAMEDYKQSGQHSHLQKVRFLFSSLQSSARQQGYKEGYQDAITDSDGQQPKI